MENISKNTIARNSHLAPQASSEQRTKSLGSLITWNISKVLEKNPNIDLQRSIKDVQNRLENDSGQVSGVVSPHPEEQHLVCAMLAWQQLGHSGADSLYQFIESKRSHIEKCSKSISNNENNDLNTLTMTSNSINISYSNDSSSRVMNSTSFGSYSRYGPVVKLPVDTKTVMRVDNITCKRETKKRRSDGQSSSKIRAACCMESSCAEKLASMDKATEEQRIRAAKLARREAERVDLLERAEAAWRDLEIGFQRRLSRAEEAEESLMRQIQKLYEERQSDKNSCEKLATSLKVIGEATEKEKNALTAIEKEVCNCACTRLKLLEENARGEAALTEQYCKSTQLDRDLQFKEEQARRKLQTMESETESARALSYEAERALHAELGGLRDQIKQVSAQLLEEDAFNTGIKKELEVLRQDKKGMIEDIDGCKEKCDRKIQLQLDKLQQKRDELKDLKEKVFDCKCKLPVDVSVEAKRTPSLAAMCTCAPENRLLGTCSCTSLKSTLISTLLADLFNGLQSELGFTGGEMPCQLLKCLEDNHNWDRNSVVKTNLRNFFSQLLVGELDIAIASSIEKYHAKWVGASCADFGKFTAGPDDDTSKPDWEKRALEKRATKLAEKLAEQIYEKKAEELKKQAKEIVTSGPPPCECSKMTKPATFPCLLEVDTPFGGPRVSSYETGASSPESTCWKRTQRDVTQLRLQIEDLKKESIKKEDLRLMENKLAKIVKKVAVPESDDSAKKDSPMSTKKNCGRETICFKDINHTNINESLKLTNATKLGLQKKKLSLGSNYSKKSFMNDKPTKQTKKHTYHQSYAVNLCLCGAQNIKPILQASRVHNESKPCIQNPSEENRTTQPKPINVNCLYPENSVTSSKCSMDYNCGSQCQCFQKVPSNSSIDNLLQTLVQWKSDLGNTKNTLSKSNLSNKSFLEKPLKRKKNKVLIDTKVAFSNNMQDNCGSGKIHDSLKGGEINNNQMISFSQAGNTASVYMAAISLDKSNDLVNECVIDSSKEHKEAIDKNISNNCGTKCLDLPIDELDKNVIYGDINSSMSNVELNKIHVLNAHLYGKSKNAKNLNVLTNSKSTKVINQQDNDCKLANKDIVQQTEQNKNGINQTDMFLNEASKKDLDYYIKFLGVTLTDTDSHNVLNNLEAGNEIVTNTKLSQKYNDNKIEQRYLGFDPFPSMKQSILHANESKNSPKINKKCDCNANFEDFKRFMINIVKKQLKMQNPQHKDIALDSQSFRYVTNSIEDCVCCHHSNADNSKELEVNAFQLLEDYLRKKLKSISKCSCQTSCLPPAEEKEIFSSMLKKVKQVISDCANEMSHERGCLTTSGSWERAYGLLQEYLKIKMKRVQCLPFLNENKDVVLPDILEKVCNLIEADFKRLKTNMCKCKNGNKYKVQKNTAIKQSLHNYQELPEKDTNIANVQCDASHNSMIPLTCQNALKHNVAISANLRTKNKSCDDLSGTISIPNMPTQRNLAQPISIKQNVSLQVPLGLGMETKSCDALQLDSKYEQGTIHKSVNLKDTSEVVVYNNCDCCHNPKKPNNKLSQLFPNKDVLDKLYADILNPHSFDRSNTRQETTQCRLLKPALKSKSLPNVNTTSNVNDINVEKINNYTSRNQSYTDYNKDCTSKDNLPSKKCGKLEVWGNWQQSIDKDNNCNIKRSNAKNALKNKCSPKFIGHINCSKHYQIPDYSKLLTNYKNMRGVETDIQNREEVVLIVSKHEVNAVHNATNTVQDCRGLGVPIKNEDILDIFDGNQTLKTEASLSMNKFTDSAYFYETVDGSEQYDQNVTTMDTENVRSPMICNCDKVPICHVKMLVDNIEKRIIQSECTCDSVYKICPVHTINTS